MMLEVPGNISGVRSNVTANRRRRGILISVSSVTESNVVAKDRTKCKKQFHGELLDTRSISRNFLMKPRSSMVLRTINTGPSFTTTIILDNTGPMETKEFGMLTIDKKIGDEFGWSKGTIAVMSIELLVKSLVPQRPIRKTLKASMSELG